MQNPFDDDMNTMPEPPPLDDSEPKYKFPSAVGYETVPDDFKPTADRPVPALRCSHVREDGSRCKKFGIKGTGVGAGAEGTGGVGGMPSMCLRHGGSLPHVRAKADALVLSARMRLIESLPMALDTLLDLAENANAEAIRLKASTEVLDRTLGKGSIEMKVEITSNENPSDGILKKLQIMRERAAPKLEDLGETVEEDAEDQAEAPLHVN